MEEMLELEAAKDDLLKKVSQQQGALQRVNEELSLQKRESEDAVEQHEKETDALKEELNNKMGELVSREVILFGHVKLCDCHMLGCHGNANGKIKDAGRSQLN